MVVSKVVVDGFENLMNCIKELGGVKSNKLPIFVFFTGSKLSETGLNWCPDCAKAEPIINEALKNERLVAANDINFITCYVGLRDYWKNPSNPFKSDEQLKITCIPTLLQFSANNSCLNNDEDFVDAEKIVNFLTKSE